MKKSVNKPLSLEQRAMLAAEVFDVVYEAFDVFGEDFVGVDLAYLMGAILDPAAKESWVDWSPEDLGHREVAILPVLREHFPANSPLWSYIVLEWNDVEKEEEAAVINPS